MFLVAGNYDQRDITNSCRTLELLHNNTIVYFFCETKPILILCLVTAFFSSPIEFCIVVIIPSSTVITRYLRKLYLSIQSPTKGVFCMYMHVLGGLFKYSCLQTQAINVISNLEWRLYYFSVFFILRPRDIFALPSRIFPCFHHDYHHHLFNRQLLVICSQRLDIIIH
jgi:hypothetical protein